MLNGLFSTNTELPSKLGTLKLSNLITRIQCYWFFFLLCEANSKSLKCGHKCDGESEPENVH